MLEENFCLINWRGNHQTPYFNIFNSARKFFGRKLQKISQNRPKNSIFFNISIITVKILIVEEKFGQINWRGDHRTPYFNIFSSARKFFGRKLPKISQRHPKNTRKHFFQQDEHVKLLLMRKTIAKGKCFGSPARQRDFLVFQHFHVRGNSFPLTWKC